MIAICGIDCSKCPDRADCGGCMETGGRPYNAECIVANCCHDKKFSKCDECSDKPCALKAKAIDEFNELHIEGMEKITELNSLLGSIINMDYKLPNGQTVKFFDDKKGYLGNLIQKQNSTNKFGLAADAEHLSVCEFAEGSSEAELIIYKKRK